MATQNNVILKQMNECKLKELSNDLLDLTNNYNELLNTLNQEIEENNNNVREITKLKLKLRDIENNGVLMSTDPFNNCDTILNQCKYDVVDEYHSKHYYDKNGPNSENLQYLQLDSTTNIPSSTAGTMNCCFYEDDSGSYMFGVSTQSLYYSNIPGYTLTDADNYNRLTKREMFNLLQDIEVINNNTNQNDKNYDTFTSIWGRTTLGKPTFDGWYISANNSNRLYTGADNFWNFGTNMSIWRYDINKKTVISRQLASMLKEIDPNGIWQSATGGRGPVTSFGDGRFVVTSTNPTISNIVVFDKDLNPIVNHNLSSYGAITIPDPKNITEKNYNERSLYVQGVNTDQINSVFVRKWNKNDLTGYNYTSLFDNSIVNVFNTDDNNTAIFLYVSYSSQGQYDALDKTSSYSLTGILCPLTDSKWSYSSGKVVLYSMYKDNQNKWKITPVKVFKTCPDDYQPGDYIKLESFTKCPDRNYYEPLKIFHPLIDNRSSVINLSGYEQFRSNVWREGYNQFKFTDGSNNTLPKSSGLHKFSVNILDSSENNVSFRCVYYQDIYSTSYNIYKDSNNNEFFRQIALSNIQLNDPDCAYYLGDGTIGNTTSRRYKDLSTNVFYYINQNGDYTVDGTINGQQDPIINNLKLLRREILNNGFCKRYMFTPYQLDPSGNGLTSSTGFHHANQSNANPQAPPFASSVNNRNPGAKMINADFYFPNNHVFDSTQYYYSRPYSLNWEDTREWLGAYLVTGTIQPNNNKGNSKQLDPVKVKEFFRLCQTAQSQNVSEQSVQVLLPGEQYTDLSGSTTIPQGSIAFKVKGEVLSCQPMILTIDPLCVDKLQLTPYLAKQLNFYGSGIYGKLSLLQDENNDYHLFGGASNGNYAPLSDQILPAEYTVRKVLLELNKLFNGQTSELPLSLETAKLLGFGNMVNNPVEGRIRSFNTRIIDNNGQELLDCTLRGVSDLFFRILCYTNNYYSDLSSNWTLSTGQTVLLKHDITTSNVFSYPFRDPNGTQVQLTGIQTLECYNFAIKLHEYRSHVSSLRARRLITNRSYCLNPKNLELEHIITGKYNDIESYYGLGREFHKLLADDFLIDQGQNRDEVQGVVTCGDKYIASAGKTTIKIINKSKVSGSKAKLISYNNKTNFALSYTGELGRTDLTNSYEYGNDDYFIGYQNYAQIAGGMAYVGKYNNNDMFVNTMGAFMFCENATNKCGFPIVPIFNNVKYNNFDLRGITKSQDGKIFRLPKRPADSMYGDIVNRSPNTFKNGDKVTTHKLIYGFTGDENGKIKIVWITIVECPIPNLLLGINTSHWGQVSGCNQGIYVVNDLIFVPSMRELYVLKSTTGEIIATYYADDFDFDENNLPEKTTLDLQTFGSVQYGNGNLYIYPGYRRTGTNFSSYSRKIFSLNLKVNNKINLPLNTLDISNNLVKSKLSGNKDIVFNPLDTINYNNNKFVLITTFLTRDQYLNRINGYKNIDLEFDALYHSGFTAIAISSNNKFLSNYINATNINDKFVNGGSWYAATGLSYNDISSNILFLYAGQIPSIVTKQSPFIISSRQILEARTVRNQKRLLSECFRVKNGNTYPYPDNGYYVGKCNVLVHNTIKTIGYWNKTDNSISSSTAYNPNFNPYNTSSVVSGNIPNTKSQIWNQSLGYTDIGKRLFNTPL